VVLQFYQNAHQLIIKNIKSILLIHLVIKILEVRYKEFYLWYRELS